MMNNLHWKTGGQAARLI